MSHSLAACAAVTFSQAWRERCCAAARFGCLWPPTLSLGIWATARPPQTSARESTPPRASLVFFIVAALLNFSLRIHRDAHDPETVVQGVGIGWNFQTGEATEMGRVDANESKH